MLKHQDISNRIRQEITSGRLRQGDVIPSYRALMKEHDVAFTTVRQAIAHLQSEGLVSPVAGRGCVVAERSVPWRHIGLAYFGKSEHFFFQDILVAVQPALAKRSFDLTLHCVPNESPECLAAWTAWAKRQAGVIAQAPFSAETLKPVMDAGVPMVIYGTPWRGEAPPSLSLVTADEPATMSMALGHLASLGHRRILFVSRLGTRHYQEMHDLFVAQTRDMGLDTIPPLVLGNDDEGEDRLLPALEALRPAPTALLVEDGRRATRLVQRLRFGGWPVPQRISVLSISGAGPGRHVLPDLSLVFGDSHKGLARALSILMDQIECGGGPALWEKRTPVLIPGATCRPVHSLAAVGGS
ncbi:MAG TPA: substrate-binding domain-containing protein [Candidatus Brocadiia bacterium]|nr:substrate-binding domain-containing protein [Candidatus Brocadiia bacterium]